MATANDPTGGADEHVTAAPPAPAPAAIQDAPEAPIPLPPIAPPPAPAPAPPTRATRVLDNLLAAAVVLFAFLVALFPATNSDVFLHAAAGRLIAGGQFPFGADPFTFTSAGTRWVNHSWLYDLGVYAAFGNLEVGGKALVLLKALLVAAAAALMLGAARRPGQSLWLPACCVGLAVLALSPRVLLQSVCLSYALLALTLWLLRRPRQLRAAAPDAAPSYRAFWLLPPLFALWVNLDAWFFVGPVTVALYLLGEFLQERFAPGRPDEDRPAPGELRALGLALAVGVAACLLNPYHVYAFTSPFALLPSATAPALRHDVMFRSLFYNPWEAGYFQRGIGLSAAGLAYFPLLLLGLFSFTLQGATVRWSRLLVWLAFAVLGGLHARSIPFFAVVAGPLTALNFLDYAAAGPARAGGRRWGVVGRSLTLAAAVALLVAAWPGWLQAEPHRQRHAGWGVRVDPSLERAARQMQEWRRQGLLGPDDRLFNVSPEVTNYLAWFCPGQQGFLDQRLPLFWAAADDFVTARKALSGEDVKDQEGPAGAGDAEAALRRPRWRDVFQRRGVRFVFFHTHDAFSGRATLTRLLSNPNEFTPCYFEGRSALFGWREPTPSAAAAAVPDPGPFAALAVDFRRRAFGPDPETAPPQGPAGEPSAHEWWMDLYTPAPGHALGSDSAVLHAARFTALSPRWLFRNVTDWERAIAAAAVGSASLPGGPLANGALVPVRMSFSYNALHGVPLVQPTLMDERSHQLLNQYVQAEDAGPPSSLYLAVRAARRGLRDEPEDPRAHLVLGDVYSSLAFRTREHQRGQVLPHVPLIRQTQIAAALNRCLQLNPALEVQQNAHYLLSSLYHEHRFIEMEAQHRRKLLECAQQLGPLPGEEEKAFNDRMEKLEKEVKAIEREVKDRQDRYVVDAANKPLMTKAETALKYNLAKTALDELLKADPKDLPMPGWTLEFNLLLSMGRVGEVRTAFDTVPPEKRAAFGPHPTLGVPAFEWAQVQLAAADGNYDEADKLLGALLEHVARDNSTSELLSHLDVGFVPKEGAPPLSVAEMMSLAFGNILLEEAPVAAGRPWRVQRLVPRHLQPPHMPQMGWKSTLGQTSRLGTAVLQQQTDLRTVRGWLALEAGRVADARRDLEAVLKTARVNVDRPGVGPLYYFRATYLARGCLDLLAPPAK